MRNLVLIVFAIVCILVVSVVVVLLNTAPGYEVTRSATIEAPAASVFAHVASPRRWHGWAVWTTAGHPDVTVTYDGPESGLGARSKWNAPSGNGRLEITRSEEPETLEFELRVEGLPPAGGSITLAPGGVTVTGAGEKVTVTRVTVTVSGEVDDHVFLRAMKALGRIEAILGAQLEESLDRLKSATERG